MHEANPSGRVLAARCALSLAMTCGCAAAQTAPAASPPAQPQPAQSSCAAAEQHQFDFWIGSWDVFTPNGKKAGDSRIEPIADGCALLENWNGQGNVSGKSLNIYSRDDKRWHQTWVDNSGSLLVIAGGLAGKSMVMSSDPALSGPWQRITWTPNDDGSVRQLWEASADAGTSWTVQFDGRYVRRK